MSDPGSTGVRLEHLPADLFDADPAARARLAAVPGLDLSPRPDPLAPDERAHLATALEAALAPREPPVAVLDGVRALGEPGASAVCVEAAPALLGGRLEALWGALTAVRLARELSRDGPPVVPVLWVDADGHDPEAVHPAWLVNPSLDLRRVGLPGLGSGRHAHGKRALDAARHRLGAVRELAAGLVAEGPHRAAALDLALPRDGETLAGAFTRMALELLGPLGLVVVEPGFLRADLSRALADLVGQPGLLPEGEEGVLRLEDGRNRALLTGGDGWTYADEPGSRTPAELAAAIVGELGEDPAAPCFHPGPSLRPFVQERVLPTRARVVPRRAPGPVEPDSLLARMAGPRAPRLPALAATVLEAPDRAALAALGVDVRGALAALAAEDRARAAGPDPAADAPGAVLARELREVTGRARRDLLELRERLAQVDPGLAGQLKRVARDLGRPVDRLAERAERVASNRRGGARRHLRRLRAALLPGGRPQAEVLPPLPFLARHGPGWVAALADELEARPVEHVLVHLGD